MNSNQPVPFIFFVTGMTIAVLFVTLSYLEMAFFTEWGFYTGNIAILIIISGILFKNILDYSIYRCFNFNKALV